MKISDADDIKIGSTQVDAVYIGSDLVLGGSPDAMVVDGAGTVEVNGIYTRDGTASGRPAYRYGNIRITVTQDPSEPSPQPPRYIFTQQILFDSYYYYRSTTTSGSVPSSPELVTWEKTTDGSDPAPTVRRAIASDF